MALSISPVKAFIALGRLMVIRAMWPFFSYVNVSGSSSVMRMLPFMCSAPPLEARQGDVFGYGVIGDLDRHADL